jgi:hypothetical protein
MKIFRKLLHQEGVKVKVTLFFNIIKYRTIEEYGESRNIAQSLLRSTIGIGKQLIEAPSASDNG